MLDPEEEKEMIRLAGKMGGQWTPNLYNTFAPKFALTAIETVFLRRSAVSGKVEILLIQRPATDAHYPNQWHSPGTMLRAVDFQEETVTGEDIPAYDGFKKAFDRLAQSELGIGFKTAPRQIMSIFHYTPRGPEVALIFLCELEGEPKAGRFFAVDHLPENLIEHHHRIIEAAMDALRRGL